MSSSSMSVQELTQGQVSHMKKVFTYLLKYIFIIIPLAV